MNSLLSLPRKLASLCTVILLCQVPTTQAFTPTSDGLYAVFTTTKGEFTARLFFDQVPMTVANFVGLAEGTQTWRDGDGELQNTPFYNGIIFHRVVANFVIQAGSPNGIGNDGPGYSFPDEIDASLSHGTTGGILSMANAGPNSNGSQFFVTLGDASFLDYKHAVFGEIVDGMNVVNDIGDDEVDGNSRPVSDVVIQSVQIVREGADAEAFDIFDWRLPRFSTEIERIHVSVSQDTITTSERVPMGEQVLVRESVDLESWGDYYPVPVEYAGSATLIDFADLQNENARTFYELAKEPLPRTSDVSGSTLSLNLTEGPTQFQGPFTLQFGTDTPGTYDLNGITGDIFDYTWHLTGHQVQVTIDFNGALVQFPMQIHFNLGENNEGTVLQYVPDSFPGANDAFFLKGTFVYTPPPSE